MERRFQSDQRKDTAVAIKKMVQRIRKENHFWERMLMPHNPVVKSKQTPPRLQQRIKIEKYA